MNPSRHLCNRAAAGGRSGCVIACVRQQTTRTKRCLSQLSPLAMTHPPMLWAKKSGCKIDGQYPPPEIFREVEFGNGAEHQILAGWSTYRQRSVMTGVDARDGNANGAQGHDFGGGVAREFRGDGCGGVIVAPRGA